MFPDLIHLHHGYCNRASSSVESKHTAILTAPSTICVARKMARSFPSRPTPDLPPAAEADPTPRRAP